MASFVKTGEHYYKSLDVFKEKSDEFVRNIEIVRYHMASVIQRLPQNQSCFNILSVGSGTGEMDMEILKIMKEGRLEKPETGIRNRNRNGNRNRNRNRKQQRNRDSNVKGNRYKNRDIIYFKLF